MVHVMKFISILKSKVKGSCRMAEDIGHVENYWVKESQKKMLTPSEQLYWAAESWIMQWCGWNDVKTTKCRYTCAYEASHYS